MSRNVPGEDQEEREEVFLKKLSELPPRPRRIRNEGTLYSQIAKWYEELKSAKERGYTYADLVLLLRTDAGITTTPGTLRKYMNRAAKEEGGAVDASVDPIPLPQKLAPVPKPLKKPSAEEERRGPPRPTLYARGPGAQVNEDEFENLSRH